MRLINTATGRLQDFDDSSRPRYAVLSHTWGDQETPYLDFLFLTSELPANALGAVQVLLRNPSKDTEGFRKIQECCQLARNRGLEWLWIDTCCIDKSSSAELSEAINSMWQWYADAVECYVYLRDVPISPGQLGTSMGLSVFSRARWFTRGWTLQELLAPKNVVFYNNRWQMIATKAQIGSQLSSITRIPLVFLEGTYAASDSTICSVAMKMSWLSRRQTTRTEDMAYCMLGLFDVHMPLIYGEGRKAFMRLQMEILKKIDDDSIFCWTADLDSSGLLATWPTAFASSENIVQLTFPEDPTPWLPPSMTSLGLEMRGRYQRQDQQQRIIDAQHGVHTINTALPLGSVMSMVMHCGPHGNFTPITQRWTRSDIGLALVIRLHRFGATWQRVNCRSLEWNSYSMYEPSQLDAYTIYYIAQQGL
ncbi:hypothetical protein AC579_4427 [Pseudocercospora musae]|uniref:Uncharacterized protein n=1 Tax=Pseudocercospora musae TaxID=113226 RepID=A0A139I181_9PEZI|nr:hypothetical protein AC579_4427 [Pseudocercospora musae]